MRIGKSIKLACIMRDTTQGELALNVGKTDVTISNYVNRKTDPPLSVVVKMAAYFEMKVSEFIKLGE